MTCAWKKVKENQNINIYRESILVKFKIDSYEYTQYLNTWKSCMSKKFYNFIVRKEGLNQFSINLIVSLLIVFFDLFKKPLTLTSVQHTANIKTSLFSSD